MIAKTHYIDTPRVCRTYPCHTSFVKLASKFSRLVEEWDNLTGALQTFSGSERKETLRGLLPAPEKPFALRGKPSLCFPAFSAFCCLQSRHLHSPLSYSPPCFPSPNAFNFSHLVRASPMLQHAQPLSSIHRLATSIPTPPSCRSFRASPFPPLCSLSIHIPRF